MVEVRERERGGAGTAPRRERLRDAVELPESTRRPRRRAVTHQFEQDREPAWRVDDLDESFRQR